MYALRRMSTRHARFLQILYVALDGFVLVLTPLFIRFGLDRLERPIAWLESRAKGALFDCRMCGRCVLAATGMTCPMNSPKGLRNGPYGDVRTDGHCEVER